MKASLNFGRVFWMLAIIFASHCKGDKKFVRDLPDFKNGRSATLQAAQIYSDSLFLKRLENGFDSLQIRVWLLYNHKDTIQAITIKNQNSKWSAYFSQGVYAMNEPADSPNDVRFISRTRFEISPKLQWKEFIDSLEKQNILELPDFSKIMSVNDLPFEGANSLLFEISTVDRYRIYRYELPCRFSKKFHQAADACDILDFLSNQFGIKYLGNF